MKHNFITHSVLIITLFTLLSNPINIIAQEQRNPLMEYMTATWCPWCPCGDVIIQQILSNMPNVIFLGYHVHDYVNGRIDPWEEFPGDTIRSLLSFWLSPSGVIDRTGPPLERDAWIDSMNSRYNVPATVSITTNSTFNELTKELIINIHSTALQNLSGNYRMNLVILEDSLVYPQAGNGSCTGGAEYVHLNVVRAMINEAEGEDLNGGNPWNSGETITKSNQYLVPPEFIAENCKIVVFIYNAQSPLYNAEIQQAEKFSLLSFPSSPIKITSPNGGNILVVGDSHNITWSSMNVQKVGIYLSTDNGISWSSIEDSIMNNGIYEWSIPNNPSTECLIKIFNINEPFNSDQSDSVFTIDKFTEINELFGSSSTSKYELFQNFPNPFNSSTVIYYGIPNESFVTLSMYNLIGEKIAELVNEYKDAGYYKVRFDLVNYNSGVYFYRLQAGSFVETKKMVLLK